MRYVALIQSADKKRGVTAKGESVSELLQKLKANSQSMEKLWNFPTDTWKVLVTESRTGKGVYSSGLIDGTLEYVNMAIVEQVTYNISKLETENAAKLDA